MQQQKNEAGKTGISMMLLLLLFFFLFMDIMTQIAEIVKYRCAYTSLKSLQ